MIAAPPGPERASTLAWEQAYAALEREIAKWSRRLAAGEPPLTVGEANRLLTTVTAIRAITAMPLENAQMAAVANDLAVQATRLSASAVTEALPAHAVASAKAAADALGWAYVPNRPAFLAVINGQVGQLTGDFLRLATTVQDRLIADLAAAVIAGDSPADYARRIKAATEPGFRVGQSRAFTIARTNLARAYDVATQTVYRDAAAAGVLYGWQWEASPGACPVCESLHGTVFPADDDTFRHPNCRCTMLPVVIGEDGDGTPFGEKFGTPMGDAPIELRTSPSGWTTWTLA